MNKFKIIKFYTDKKYLTQEEYEPILFPFWGMCVNANNSLLEADFSEYIKNGHKYFQISNIEDSDFILWPEKYRENGKYNQELIDLSKKYSKPNIIFFTDDSDKKINVENSFIFRTSLNRSNRFKNEFAIPAWCGDFSKRYFQGSLPKRVFSDSPIVGYCGYTKNFKDRIKSIIGIDYGIWRDLRFRAVSILKKGQGIKTNFIIRNDFWGGAYKKSKNEDFSKKLSMKVREEYVNNIVNSDYALAIRGRGNYSIRFYEILSLGRIPLFVNTDCVLPYEKHINWQDLCVWVEHSEMEYLVNKIKDFHFKISEDGFLNKQAEIRDVYDEWISPDGFFKNFYKHFFDYENNF